MAAYDLDVLAADIADLATTLGRDRFAVVGHDWGASVGWWTARNYPVRVSRLAVLNAPHPAVWKDAMANDTRQKALSGYVSSIAMPILPELLVRAGNYGSLVKALKSARRSDAFTPSDLAQYRAAWKKPGALTAQLNWYRALLKKDIPLAAERRLATPIRIIWGVDDAYAIPELATESAKLCDDAKIQYIENATHWVAHDEPERVTRSLLEFLAGQAT